MHDSLIDLLDKADLAVSESTGVISPDVLDPVARVARTARDRLSYPQSTLVAALAGGTGSGKSSLFNALAGEDLALTGGIRPMTVDPLALVPAEAQGSLDGLLDGLGIGNRVEREGTPWLCVIDLPDNDSVDLGHRRQVDELLPRVDVVVWVTDPEKYRDASLHSGHIAPLASYQRQFVFVLNQIDRLDPSDVGAVIADLAEALGEDGIDDPVVVAAAASPESGPPIGIDRVLGRLEDARDRRLVVLEKLLVDLGAASASLVSASSGGGGVDFERRWRHQLDRCIGLALDDRVADGGHEMARFVATLGDEVGDETAAGLHAIADGAQAVFLSSVIDSSGPPKEPGTERRRLLRWRGGASPTVATIDAEEMARSLEATIGDPVRLVMARRGRAHAAVTELALAVDELGRRAPLDTGRHATGQA